MNHPLKRSDTEAHSAQALTYETQVGLLDQLVLLKARILRKVLWKLGDRFSQVAIADACCVPFQHVSRWANASSRHAPSVFHMLRMPQPVFCALITELCAAREQLGFEPLQLSAPTSADRDPALDELAALVAKMRGAR